MRFLYLSVAYIHGQSIGSELTFDVVPFHSTVKRYKNSLLLLFFVESHFTLVLNSDSLIHRYTAEVISVSRISSHVPTLPLELCASPKSTTIHTSSSGVMAFVLASVLTTTFVMSPTPIILGTSLAFLARLLCKRMCMWMLSAFGWLLCICT